MGNLLGTNVNPTTSGVNVDTLMTNPGYSQIARKILLTLDHQSQLRCRLVCQSWKKQIDRPIFWILKCDQKGQAKSLHDAWNDLFLNGLNQHFVRGRVHAGMQKRK